jgi:hypothetical protein
LSTTGPKDTLSGPFVKFRMVEAGTFLRQRSLAGPGVSVHPTAPANASKEESEGTGDEEVGAPDNNIPARKGALTRSRTMANPTDAAPAD